MKRFDQLIQEGGFDGAGFRVLLSARKTVREGNLLWIGFNPTCDKDDGGWFRTDRADDPKWENPSARRMQFAMKWFARLQCYKRVEDVCATNLVFRATASYRDVRNDDHDRCWPVVAHIIDTVNPKMITCNGVRTFDILGTQLGGFKVLERVPDGNRWIMRIASIPIGGRSTTIIGLPHLSRWSFENRFKAHECLHNHVSRG